MGKRVWILITVALLILVIFLLGCNRSDVDQSIIKNMQLAEVDDLELFEVSVLVKDVNGNPLKNANVKLYNKDNSIFFPINSRYEEFEGKQCDRVFFDENYFVTTDNKGIAKTKITKGNYLIQVGGQINSDSENKEVIYLEKEILIQNSQQIEIKAERKISINAVVDSEDLEHYEFWITKKDQKPGFPPFSMEWAHFGFDLQTNTESSLLIVKRPDDISDGFVIVEDIGLNNKQITRSNSNMAELEFESYNSNNEKEGIGSVYINLVDYYSDNFGFDFPTVYDKKLYVDPQTAGIWYRLEKEGWSFVFFKKDGKFVDFSSKDDEKFKFGGLFNIDLKIASFNPPRRANGHYIWLVVTDFYGNYLSEYKTINPSAPKITIKDNSQVVINKELENFYPDIHIDLMGDEYFGSFDSYTVDFSEDFGEFGSIYLNNEPMKNLEMELINFQSENLDFVVPKDLEFLKNDWTTNFQKFYDKMYGHYGIKTSEKIPVRVVVDGADRAWAPIVWPMVAYEHDTRNTLSWFMITHELGHPFTINAPLDCVSENDCPYNEESKASYSGITSAQKVNQVVGDHIKSKYPIVFKRLENQNVCFDKIEIVQTLMLYLDQRYPDKKPSVVLIKEWNSKYDKLYKKLRKKGFNHDEIYGALYSYVIEENVGPIFEKFGLANEKRISDALKKL